MANPLALSAVPMERDFTAGMVRPGRRRSFAGSTGDPAVDQRIEELAANIPGVRDPELLVEMLMTSARTARMDIAAGAFKLFHSYRYVGDKLVMRLMAPLTVDEPARLQQEFADLIKAGNMQQHGALEEEDDEPEMAALPAWCSATTAATSAACATTHRCRQPRQRRGLLVRSYENHGLPPPQKTN